jgi:hypothetical protein
MPPILSIIVSIMLGTLAFGCGSEEDDRPAEWSYISPAIIQPSCATASCHSKHTAAAGLQLHDAKSGWSALVNGGFVIPGQPESSKLVYMLRGEEVYTMPPDGALPDVDIELIERWILAGAEQE